MRFLSTVLVVTLSLALCSGALWRVNAGEAVPVRQNNSVPQLKASQSMSSAKPAATTMGFCCANGKVAASSEADCQAKKGRFFTTAGAAHQACQKITKPLPMPPVGKMNPANKPSGASTLKSLPGQIAPVAPIPSGGVPPSPLPTVNGVDLQTTAWQWSTFPKVGATIGTTAILTITITNTGTEPAAANLIAIGVESAPDGAPTADLVATYECPALAPGKAMSFAWPSASAAIWQKGTYQFSFAIDKNNAIAESNEQNNHRIFTIEPNLLMAAKPSLQLQSSQLQVGRVDLAIESTPPWPAEIVLDTFDGEGTFRANVTNTGTVASPPTTVRLSWVNPQTNGTSSMGQVPLPSLSVGESTVVQVTGSLPYEKRRAGTHHLRMVIDPLMEISEVTRDNNHTDLMPVDFILKSDLTFFKPGEATFFPDRLVHLNEPVTMVFTVYNMTPESFSGPITVTLTCQGQPAGVEHYAEIGGGNGLTGGCGGHGCHTFSFTRAWSTTGVKNCEVTVRHQGGAEYEVDPTNNHASFMVNILPD